VQEPLMEYVDVLLGSAQDARQVFGLSGGEDLTRDACARLAADLMERFAFKAAAITFEEPVDAWRSRWSGVACDGSGAHQDPASASRWWTR
jgi:hypothetical protein